MRRRPLGDRFTRLFGVLWRDVVLNKIIATKFIPSVVRWRLLRFAGVPIQRSVVSAGVFFGGTNVRIGRGSFINYQVFLDNVARIEIGDRVWIGPRTMLITGSHELGGPNQRAGEVVGRRVAICDGVWLGANVTVLPGVEIGPGAVVGAGSVVTHDCEPNSVYAGVPARLLRRL